MPASADPVLPDLIADPPENAVLIDEAGEGGVARRLLRFDGHVHNAGAGALTIRGVGITLAGMATVEQLLQGGDPILSDAADMKFENTDGHNHWHLQRIARYSLWDAAGATRVAPVMKVGFCLLDSLHVSGPAPRVYDKDCLPQAGSPGQVTMGVSPGWRDLYARNLPFQWVDVSETLPGSYRLRSEVDPEGFVAESGGANVPADTTVVVRGHVAEAGFGGPPTAATFGSPGLPSFRTLETAADRYVYVAEDASDDFPRFPARATMITAAAGTPAVALSRIPTAVRGGESADLDATTFNTSGPVAWTAGAGTIDADGRFTAPLLAPRGGGEVRVTATAPDGSKDAMDIEILAPPEPDPEPAPTPEFERGSATPAVPAAPPRLDAPAPPRAEPPLPARSQPRSVAVGSVRFRSVGPQIAVAVVPRFAGRLRVTLLRGRTRLGTCVLRVRARRAHVCRLERRRGATALAVTLVRAGGRTEQRRVPLGG